MDKAKKILTILSDILAGLTALQELLADGFQVSDVKVLIEKYETDPEFQAKIDKIISKFSKPPDDVEPAEPDADDDDEPEVPDKAPETK